MASLLSMFQALLFPPAPFPPRPDWAAFEDYYALAKAISAAHPISSDAFLGGPFTRNLELSSTNDHPLARARAMEFATASFRRQREAMVERGEPVDEFEGRA